MFCCEFDQFTNKQDEHKKDIYAGDICYAFKSNSCLDGYYEVAWNERKACWFYKDAPKSRSGSYQIGVEAT